RVRQPLLGFPGTFVFHAASQARITASIRRPSGRVDRSLPRAVERRYRISAAPRKGTPMKEKTLLYGALTATALAAAFAVLRGHEQPGRIQIAPVNLADPSHVVSKAEVPIALTASD